MGRSAEATKRGPLKAEWRSPSRQRAERGPRSSARPIHVDDSIAGVFRLLFRADFSSPFGRAKIPDAETGVAGFFLVGNGPLPEAVGPAARTPALPVGRIASSLAAAPQCSGDRNPSLWT